jgi:hypothetical protein
MLPAITLEMADHDNPLARCSSTFRQLISRNGRPICFPSSRARATPAFVRSLRLSRSRSATQLKMANIRFLIERSVVRVHASFGDDDHTITPHSSSSPRTMSSVSRKERPTREISKTYRVVTSRAGSRTYSSNARKPGRSDAASYR